MKKLFFEEDGKISISSVLIVILVIIVIGLAILDIKLFSLRGIKNDFITFSTTTKTTKFILCKDCNLNFKNNIELVTNHEYDIEDIVDFTNINPTSAKYTINDKELASIKNKNKKVYLNTLDKVGIVKIKIAFDKVEIEKEIIINEGEIISAKLLDHPYYIYIGQANNLDIISNPKNIDISKLDLTFENPDIAEIKSGKVIGKQIGETKVILNFLDQKYESELVVVKNKINIEYNKKEVYNVNCAELTKKELDIIVTLDDRDNEGLTNDSLSIEHIDEGLNAYVNYNNKNMDKDRSYNYKIVLDNIEKNGKSTILFKLSDGTRRILTIYNEE